MSGRVTKSASKETRTAAQRTGHAPRGRAKGGLQRGNGVLPQHAGFGPIKWTLPDVQDELAEEEDDVQITSVVKITDDGSNPLNNNAAVLQGSALDDM